MLKMPWSTQHVGYDSPGELSDQGQQYKAYITGLVAMTLIHSILQYAIVPTIEKICVGDCSFTYVDKLMV
jgi:hypothetical protein